MSFLLGFDIGGTKCAVVLGILRDDDTLAIVAKQVFPTDRGPYPMLEFLFKKAGELLASKAVALAQVIGVGISCGGPLDSRAGVVLSPPNLPGWDRIPIVALAENHFGKPTRLQNDANACALAEWKYGAGQGTQNLIFLTFGTGMGAGLILDGRLYAGTCDLAGEVGHLRLAEYGPAGFGKAGSFEGFCSGGGIAQLAQTRARQVLQVGKPVTFCANLESLPAITAKAVAEAAYAGDELAQEVYRECGHYLGRGLALLIDILNPEVIILGSIFHRAYDLIQPAMETVLRQETISFSREVCRIVPAGLGESVGDMAALSLAVPLTQ